jgi:hypothetical protein
MERFRKYEWVFFRGILYRNHRKLLKISLIPGGGGGVNIPLYTRANPPKALVSNSIFWNMLLR